MKNIKPEFLLYGVAAIIAWSLYKKTGAAVGVVVDEVSTGVDITSTENWVYSGVNALGDIIDDGQNDNSFSLGSWLYDVTHPNEGF